MFWAGLLSLLAGIIWPAVVAATQGVDQANAWAGVLAGAMAIGGALVGSGTPRSWTWALAHE